MRNHPSIATPGVRRPLLLPGRRGFSLVEFMVAITISTTLLAATLGALDASFKSYKATTESASVNVTTRLAMHRLTTLIRNAENFGPYPVNPIATPTITSTEIEFEAVVNPGAASGEVERQVWRIVRMTEDTDLGPFRLDAEVTSLDPAGVQVGSAFTQVLMYKVTDARFLLDYDVGPRLRRATIDLTVGAREDQADTLETDLTTRQIRMVSSVRPRRLDID